ncbi:hypothetical protein KZE55_03025 [Limosilactobacillus panis]|uniref:hypothetical protein n=1 Tax=Limosilactobacillus panis TaxID=47493 RepID=UPI001C95EF27|nr:hypothetical protein [Limosilactobacillus panis]QZN93540.1 hypothetical protein KZE55_03025 [Limosilactobacillus panis]
MVKQLSSKQFNSLQQKIGAERKDTNVLYVQLNETVGAGLEYYTDTGTFDLDILEPPLEDRSKRLARYSHSYPPCLVPTDIRLLRQYVEAHGGNFEHVREYEANSNKGFADYFEQQTGIPYADLVNYEPR